MTNFRPWGARRECLNNQYSRLIFWPSPQLSFWCCLLAIVTISSVSIFYVLVLMDCFFSLKTRFHLSFPHACTDFLTFVCLQSRLTVINAISETKNAKKPRLERIIKPIQVRVVQSLDWWWDADWLDAVLHFACNKLFFFFFNVGDFPLFFFLFLTLHLRILALSMDVFAGPYSLSFRLGDSEIMVRNLKPSVFLEPASNEVWK